MPRLIRCPDCNKKVSRRATSCPACGAPRAAVQEAIEKAGKAVKRRRRIMGTVLLAPLLLVFCVNLTMTEEERAYLAAETSARESAAQQRSEREAAQVAREELARQEHKRFPNTCLEIMREYLVSRGLSETEAQIAAPRVHVIEPNSYAVWNKNYGEYGTGTQLVFRSAGRDEHTGACTLYDNEIIVSLDSLEIYRGAFGRG